MHRKRKSVKAFKHAKNIFFDQKLHFFTKILERSICTHLHHSDLDSGGQIYLKMTKIFSAYAKTMCWWNSSRLYSLISLEVIMLDLLQCSGLYLGCLFVLTKQLNENVKIIRQRGSLFYNSLCDKNSLPNPVNWYFKFI